MKKFLHTTLPAVTLGALPLVIATAGIAGYGVYRYAITQEKKYADLKAELRSEVLVLGEKIVALEGATKAVEQDLSVTKMESEALGQKASSLETNVSQISGAVGTLEKLSKTDPELLQKYSKVFFLSENYAPERLVEIPKEYLYSEARIEQFEQRVWPHLQNLLDSAKQNGITLYVKSAYRSFNEQKSLKSSYSVLYGAGTANQFSAEQGYSEHQLGTTVDFITTGLGGQLFGFERTNAYAWLASNAHRFGFTLSYPKGNAYYIFEPWHWRFVGKELAALLYREGMHFYDLDQREIDTYLVNILDY